MYTILMMKQPHVLLDKRNPQLTRRLKTRLIILTARRRGDVFDAAPPAAIDVVGKREERVATAGDF